MKVGGPSLRARRADTVAVLRKADAGHHHGAVHARVPGLAALDDLRPHHARHGRLYRSGAGPDVHGQFFFFVVTEPLNHYLWLGPAMVRIRTYQQLSIGRTYNSSAFRVFQYLFCICQKEMCMSKEK